MAFSAAHARIWLRHTPLQCASLCSMLGSHRRHAPSLRGICSLCPDPEFWPRPCLGHLSLCSCVPVQHQGAQPACPSADRQASLHTLWSLTQLLCMPYVRRTRACSSQARPRQMLRGDPTVCDQRCSCICLAISPAHAQDQELPQPGQALADGAETSEPPRSLGGRGRGGRPRGRGRGRGRARSYVSASDEKVPHLFPRLCVSNAWAGKIRSPPGRPLHGCRRGFAMSGTPITTQSHAQAEWTALKHDQGRRHVWSSPQLGLASGLNHSC